jgi:DNA (cytosine-5)-methyltransferase 1
MHGARPLCVDLFAGVGGLSLGFEQAGFDVACAVEFDPVHAAAHAYNFPTTPVIVKSVVDVTGADIRAAAGIGEREVAVVVGGSPCQGFSMIGKRMLDDPRNALVAHFVRLVVEISPRYFVLENVKGLTVGKHAAFLDELVASFDEAGYDVVRPWKVLNASSFGVPQHRERLFIMGARRGLPLPAYPEALTRPSGRKVRDASLPAGPTVADALFDLPDAEAHPELFGSDETEAAHGAPSDYAAVLRGEADDATDFSHPRDAVPGRLTSSARSDHTALTRSRFSATVPGQVEPVSRFLRLDPAGVCNTLRAGTGKERGAFTAARPIHPALARCITVREMARLHSYPDWFRFNWTKWSGARQVGNSVPPRLGRAVGSAVAAALGHVPTRPATAVAPGNPALLRANERWAESRLVNRILVAAEC